VETNQQIEEETKMNEQEIIRTGRKDHRGDELVVFQAISDFGTPAWFTGSEYTDDRDPSDVFTSLKMMAIFKTKEGAIADLKTNNHRSYHKFQ